MLRIVIPEGELWDEKTESFLSSKEQSLQLEHSLVSISKWEAKWHKPFLSNEEKSFEETIDYIRFMTITQNVKPEVYEFLTPENIKQIECYIDDPMTAAKFSDRDRRPSREIITSETIYHWMISFNIPFECQKWHLNRLLALIKVCGNKNLPPKKVSKAEVFNRYKEINEARKKKLNSNG